MAFRGGGPARGFTLIEILVVVVILSIAAALAMSGLSARSGSGDAAQELAIALDRLVAETWLSGQPVAWRCAEGRLVFFRWSPEVDGDLRARGEWVLVEAGLQPGEGSAMIKAVAVDREDFDCEDRYFVVRPYAGMAPVRILLDIGPGSGESWMVVGDAAGKHLAQRSAATGG